MDVWRGVNIEVIPFDANQIGQPYRQILLREVEKLRQKEDVLAIGIAGSLAHGDAWSGSDIDIEVIVKGDSPKHVVTTEQEVSVDFGIFGETQISGVPFDTRPIHDPKEVLTRELASRNKDKIIEKEIQEILQRTGETISRSYSALDSNPYSALVLVHLSPAVGLPTAFTLAAGDNRTIRRTVSRLERATTKVGKGDFLELYGTLLGFPRTLAVAGELKGELQQGYREVWNYFKGKPVGPIYMQLQPDSEAWFQNRIRPLFEYDWRDLVSLVYTEFPFVLYYLFRTAGYERMPVKVFEEADKFEGPPSEWTTRYKRILGKFSPQEVPSILEAARDLHSEVERLSEKRLWARD